MPRKSHRNQPAQNLPPIGATATITSSDKREEQKESTRSVIASQYVLGFFSVIFMVIGVAVYRNFSIEGYKDMLITVSGILSGPLGFIIGYYFKSTTDT
ncbi:hypothetical protein KBC79_02860 [Candidatus Woesebacteria bacterium]|nr:hypothetical protein [Candidatus Woesebacteria bacterium]